MIPRVTRSRTIEHNRRANHLFGSNLLLFFFRTYFGPFQMLASFLLFEEVLSLLRVDRIINERAYFFCKFQFTAMITRRGCERQLFIPVDRYRPHPKLNIRVENPRQIQWLRPSANIATISLSPQFLRSRIDQLCRFLWRLPTLNVLEVSFHGWSYDNDQDIAIEFRFPAIIVDSLLVEKINHNSQMMFHEQQHSSATITIGEINIQLIYHS